MADLDELRTTFFEECEDLLDRLGSGLRELAGGAGAGPDDTVHAVFRAVHSIKGGAGAFGLDDLVGFAHLFETVLDGLRAGRTAMSPALAEDLLRAGDMLDDLVQASRDGAPPPAESLARAVAGLERHADGDGDDPLDDFVFEPVALQLDAPDTAPDTGAADPAIWTIDLAPAAAMYMNGNEPAALIAALAGLGPLQVAARTQGVVPLAGFDIDDPQLAWRITLAGDADRAAIDHLFDFVEGLARITVTRGAPDMAPQADPTGSAPPAAPAADEPAAAPPRPAAQPAPAAAPATVRVNLDRVDRLANLVGELVITESVLSQSLAAAGLASNGEIAGGLDRMRHLAGEIQESVMAIRAQPLRPVFQRMERVLREAAQATGKSARLVTTGADTEVDKTVIERLVDPLTHMIRNAVDHGLEDAATRRAAGKPEEGTITLTAAHRSGRVVIEIGDDGGGINRARVRGIAEDKGLVSPDAVLAPSEIDAILFMPGFSSKAEVSAVSGRGVGLDVVQREIQALGGRVGIASSEGAGSAFTISLPLTLAVLDGMVIEFCGQTMVLPLASVVETMGRADTTIRTTGTGGRMLATPGGLVPMIDLADRFGLRPPDTAGDPGVLVVIEGDDGSLVAVTADRILDQRQVVIKSVEDHCGAVPGISAATILGDGRIALILDPEALLHAAGAGPVAFAGGIA
ncbi:MAG: chemotaxis protein CheA [Rubellimicrobium sp.]|nr:chemotaxis protein CheA [Rubellimicrobium sp.]